MLVCGKNSNSRERDEMKSKTSANLHRSSNYHFEQFFLYHLRNFIYIIDLISMHFCTYSLKSLCQNL